MTYQIPPKRHKLLVCFIIRAGVVAQERDAKLRRPPVHHALSMTDSPNPVSKEWNEIKVIVLAVFPGIK